MKTEWLLSEGWQVSVDAAPTHRAEPLPAQPSCPSGESLSRSGIHSRTQTSTHTPHLGTHSRTPIQTCTHIIKYVQTSTCSQTDKHKHTHSHTHLNSYTDNLWALLTFICRQGALGIRKAGWAHCVWAWSQRLNYFYSLTVWLTTWLGNPSARFWTAPVLNLNFNLSELNFSDGHSGPARR